MIAFVQSSAASGCGQAIVIGDHDEAINRGHTEYIAQTVPHAKLVILKQVSHVAMLQDPQGYTAAIRAFLDAPE